MDGATISHPWLPRIVAYVPAGEAVETVNIVTNSFDAEQGLAGGATALLIVSAGAYLANRGLGELSHVYAALLQLNTLSPGDSVALLATPAALGWFGAWLSVSRHLALVEPS